MKTPPMWPSDQRLTLRGKGGFPFRFLVLGSGTLWLALLSSSCGDGQTASTVEPPRTVDRSFQPILENPRFPIGEGPVVCVDEAHNNFHTIGGTYYPFADILRKDGYRVRRFPERASPETLEGCGLLVIADAQPPARRGDPPTFSSDEVRTLNAWVRDGGALFLITDHLPDPGAIAELAASFSIELHNGYVLNGGPTGPERPLVFRAEDGTLSGDPLMESEEGAAAIRQVATFSGAALRGGESFRPLLVFGPGRESWAPEEYWVFEEDTPRMEVSGWSQGGVQEHGTGRLAVFGEAAMFTAQVFEEGRVLAGMNAPEAVDNLELLRRVVRWLTTPGSAASGLGSLRP